MSLTAPLLLSLFLAGPVFAGHFNSGKDMAENQYRKLYGVPIAPARDYQIDRFERHPMNPQRRQDRDASMIFNADIKSEGVEKDALAIKIPEQFRTGKADLWLLRGARRLEGARAAGEKTLRAEMVMVHLDHKNPKDQVTLRKLIFRDNFLRQSYTFDEIDAFILKQYGKERILTALPRGPKASKSDRSLLPMERVLVVELGMTLASAKDHLSSIRRKLKTEAAENSRLSLTDEAERTGLSMARRYQACQTKLERAEAFIARMKKKTVLPLTQEMKGIERDLRKIGGLERFLRKLK